MYERIRYVNFSSAGVKLRTVHSAANNVPVKTTNYAGNKIYENGELIRILVDGGYFDIKEQKYYFYVQDHLVNNRVVADQGGQIVQKTHYYPFGSAFAESTSEKAQPYKYNGKELDKMYGLNLYDYSARHYDAALGRFTTVDPLAEKYPSISPYAYCLNNPIRFIDPDGRDIWQVNSEGRIHNRIKNKNYDQFVQVDQKGNQMMNNDPTPVNIESQKFKYGTVQSQKSYSFIKPDGKPDVYDVYQVRGDDASKAIFEFLAEIVSPEPFRNEIGEAKTGVAGEKGINFITSGHTRRSEPGQSYLLASQLYYGYHIRELNHSHPINDKPSSPDKLFKEQVTDVLKSQKLNIPLFQIYHVDSKEYITY